MMNRRQFTQFFMMTGLACLAPQSLLALGDDDRFTIALLNYSSQRYNPRPTALRRLMLEVEKRTSILVQPRTPTVEPEHPDIFQYPFLVMAGDRRFDPLSDTAIRNLRQYIRAGGFILIDSSEGVTDGPFMQSIEREMKRIFPDNPLVDVPRDHVLYKSFYLLDEPFGRIRASRSARAIIEANRLAVVVNTNDLMGALARDNFGNWEYQISSGGDSQREMAFRFGINLIMYALTVDYKSDQVHIPFILRRRQWRVD